MTQIRQIKALLKLFDKHGLNHLQVGDIQFGRAVAPTLQSTGAKRTSTRAPSDSLLENTDSDLTVEDLDREAASALGLNFDEVLKQ